MDSKKIEQMCKEANPKLSAIISGFNDVLEANGISGVTVIEFRVNALSSGELMEDIIGGGGCTRCGPSMCCTYYGLAFQFSSVE